MIRVRVGPSGIHGLGVFACDGLSSGETVLVLDDSRTVDDEHPLRPEAGEFPWHRDFLAGGRVVLMPAPERHINSSCDPSTVVRTREGRRHVVARRDLVAGDEITYAYIVNTHGGERWTCRCGAANCLRDVPGSFFALPRDRQLAYEPQLDDWFVAEHREALARLHAPAPPLTQGDAR